jgi:hypothetical protein
MRLLGRRLNRVFLPSRQGVRREDAQLSKHLFGLPPCCRHLAQIRRRRISCPVGDSGSGMVDLSGRITATPVKDPSATGLFRPRFSWRNLDLVGRRGRVAATNADDIWIGCPIRHRLHSVRCRPPTELGGRPQTLVRCRRAFGRNQSTERRLPRRWSRIRHITK